MEFAGYQWTAVAREGIDCRDGARATRNSAYLSTSPGAHILIHRTTNPAQMAVGRRSNR